MEHLNFILTHEKIEEFMEEWVKSQESCSAVIMPVEGFKPHITCTRCKHHYDNGEHFCNRLRIRLPDDSEFYCKYGEEDSDDEAD